LLYHGGSPTSRFLVPWPAGVALQLHVMEADEWMELDVAEALRDEVAGAELYGYPGSKHLFADSSLEDYDEPAAHLLLQRTLEFLNIID
jgi:dienelactone hydrolase